MDEIKKELIEHLLNNYLEMDEMFQATGDTDYEKVCLKIDKYLGYLGVGLFELEDRKFYVRMVGGFTFVKDFNQK